MKIIISIFILIFFPILYKMVKDWNGFDHRGNGEFEYLIMIIISLSMGEVVYRLLIDELNEPGDAAILYFKSMAVSATAFQLFFPYLINWRLSYRFGFIPPRWLYILNHLSDKVVPDKYAWYRKFGWAGRLILWSSLFYLSIWWFILG